MKKSEIQGARIKAILIAFESRRNDLIKAGNKIKDVLPKFEAVTNVNTDEEFSAANSVLEEYDKAKSLYDEYVKDLNDFAYLIHHEFDLLEEPIKKAIKHGEKLVHDYKKEIVAVTEEIKNRYRKLK